MGGPTTKDRKGSVGPTKYDPGATRTLVVSVIDPAAKGKGVAGAKVEVVGLNLKTTGADGKATFKDLPIPSQGMEWVVRVDKDGHGPPPPAGLPWRVWQAEQRPVPPPTDTPCSIVVELTRPATVDITVKVVDGSDTTKVLADADVELWALRTGKTGKDGKVTWKGVTLATSDGVGLDQLDIKVRKAGFGIIADGKWSEGEVRKVVPTAGKTSFSEVVEALPKGTNDTGLVEVMRGAMPGCAGARANRPMEGRSRTGTTDASDEEAWDTSADDSMATPRVVLCGSPPLRVELKVVGQDWGKGYVPATWSPKVHRTLGSGTATPRVTGHGMWAEVATDTEGVFSIVASVNGQRRYWNVCFVKVTLGPSSSRRSIAHTHSKEGADKQGRPTVAFLSGKFTDDEATFFMTWSASLSGGAQTDWNKIHIGPVQNGIADGYEAFYPAHAASTGDATEGTIREVPRPGKFPVLDTGFKTAGGDNFFCCTDKMFASGAAPGALVKGDSNMTLARTRHYSFLDSPGVEFAQKHFHTDQPVEWIRGYTSFRCTVSARSEDFPGTVLVFGFVDWRIDLRCKVEHGMIWTTAKDDGSTVSGGNALTAVDPPQMIDAFGLSLWWPCFIQTDEVVEFKATCRPPCPKDDK